MKRFRFIFVLYLFCSVLICAKPVQAQVQDGVFAQAPQPLGDIRSVRREPDFLALKPVNERLHEDLQAVPILWRGFRLLPQLEVFQSYDDNIFATENNAESDFVTVVQPSLFVQKYFGRHAASLLVEGSARRYIENDSENVENFNSRLAGYLEARHDIRFPFELSYAINHENREQNFAANFTREPIRFRSWGSAFGISYDPNRLGISVIGRYSGIVFDDGESANTGQAVIRRDGDRTNAEVEARLSYSLAPNHEAFLSSRVGFTDYKRNDFDGSSFSGPSRDSTNYSFLAGWDTNYKGIVQGFLGAGYTVRNYDDDAIEDIDSIKLAGNIDWNITRLATLNLSLKREITEDNQVLQGVILNEVKAGLDYEVQRDLFLNFYANKTIADFQGSDREDDVFGAGVGLRYYINPRFSVGANYSYQTRDSNQPSLDYDRSRVMLRLTTRF